MAGSSKKVIYATLVGNALVAATKVIAASEESLMPLASQDN